MTQTFAEILDNYGEAPIVLLHSHYNKAKLEQVKFEMTQLGAPTVRAIWSAAYGMYFAIEGCHRLRAAHALNITPNVIDVSNQETVVVQLDGEDAQVATSDLLMHLQDGAAWATIITFEWQG